MWSGSLIEVIEWLLIAEVAQAVAKVVGDGRPPEFEVDLRVIADAIGVIEYLLEAGSSPELAKTPSTEDGHVVTHGKILKKPEKCGVSDVR